MPIPLPLYLLGLDIQERWTFAVDITPARDLFMVRSLGGQQQSAAARQADKQHAVCILLWGSACQPHVLQQGARP